MTQCHFALSIEAMQGFDNIINYLTPSAKKKKGPVHTGGVKKIDIIQAKNNVMLMSMFEFSNFYLAFTSQA